MLFVFMGIGKAAGLKAIDVEGATGNIKTNFMGKAEAALSALEDTRKRILGPLTALRSRLRAAENRDGALDACLRLLEETDAAGTLESMRRALEEQGLSSEAEDCAHAADDSASDDR